MPTQDNIKIARDAFEAWNKHDVERYLKLLDEKHVFESDTIPAPITGREGGRQFMQVYLTAFPDLHFTIDQTLGEGDFVVVRWTATGTHRGDLMGIAATGRRTITRGCTVVEVKGGKLRHDWVYWDTGHMLKQLGVLN